MPTETAPAKVAKAAAYPLIYAKMSAVMDAVVAITKGRRNSQQGYAFRGIDDCLNALHGPLSANGVVFGAAVRDVVKTTYAAKAGTAMLHVTLTVTYTFYAADGSSMSYEAVGEASDSGDKAAGKAQAYALKVALLQVFCIPTEEQKDTEYASPERAAEPVAAPVAVAFASGAQRAAITALVGHALIQDDEREQVLASLGNISADRAARRIDRLTAAIARRTLAAAVAFDTKHPFGTPNPFRPAHE